MSGGVSAARQIVDARNALLVREKELYVAAVEKLNMNTRELLKSDFGATLVKSSARDLAGEVVRRYFDMGDYYITVDHMFERIVHFSYDNDKDLLGGDEGIRKAFYNVEDSSATSETLKRIAEECQAAQRELFQDNRSQDRLDAKGKKDYRTGKIDGDGNIFDELTGRQGNTNKVTRNGREQTVSDLHADHVQARESARYNARYIRADKLDELKAFYNSPDNMQMMHASANTSKSDVRVCMVDGKVTNLQGKELKSRLEKGEKIEDITHRATAEQLVEAIVEQWEKETGSGAKIEMLKEKGYLDENGKVKKQVRKELERNIRHSQNQESRKILQTADYGQVSKDAAAHTAKSVGKILAGQMIYYVLPPLVFETQSIIRQKGATMDGFVTRLKKACARILQYVKSKLGAIFKNLVGHSFNKFIKTFFDIVIEMVKATVKKLLKIVKQLVMSLVQCVKILFDGKATAAEKADAITKTLSVSVSIVVVELLFEYLEKQFQLPKPLMEPLQIIVTIVATNVIMLVLQKADLFDVQYGLLVANIEKCFEETNAAYVRDSDALLTSGTAEMQALMADLEAQAQDIQASIEQVNPYREDVTPHLESINALFDMGIDLETEWRTFAQSL